MGINYQAQLVRRISAINSMSILYTQDICTYRKTDFLKSLGLNRFLCMYSNILSKFVWLLHNLSVCRGMSTHDKLSMYIIYPIYVQIVPHLCNRIPYVVSFSAACLGSPTGPRTTISTHRSCGFCVGGFLWANRKKTKETVAGIFNDCRSRGVRVEHRT